MSRSSSSLATSTRPALPDATVDGNGSRTTPDPRRTRRVRDGLRRIATNEYCLASVVLALLLAVFFNPIVRHDATFSTVQNTMQFADPWQAQVPREAAHITQQADHAQGMYPGQVFVRDSLEQDGQLPLWNPLGFGGHPYLASSGSRIAYPPAVILARVLSPSWAHDVYIALHLFVAGLAMFALMKEFGTRFAGALLAAIAWAFAGYTMAFIQLELFGAVAALLPLVVLCLYRWYRRGSWTSLAWGSLALGGLYLGVTAELALMAFAFAFGLAVVLALQRVVTRRTMLSNRQRIAVLAAPVGFVAAALGVAAVGVLPFLELSDRMARSALTFDELLARPGLYVAEPGDFFANTFRAPATPITPQSLFAGQVFVGTLTALFAVGALFLRRPGTGLGRVVAIGTALFALGTPFAWLVFNLAPGFDSLQGLGRSLFLFCFAVALLGGIGLDATVGWLQRPNGPFRRRSWPRWLAAVRTRQAIAIGLAAVCITVTAAQLLGYGRSVNPPFQRRDAADLYPSTPAVDAVRDIVGDGAGQGRVLPINSWPLFEPSGGTLPGASAMVLGLNSTGGYTAALPRPNLVLTRLVAGFDLAQAFDERWIGAVYTTYFPWLRTDLLGRTGVQAVLGPADLPLAPGWSPDEAAARGLELRYLGADGSVYEVVDAAPRAFVVGEAVAVDSSREELERFAAADFDVEREVVLDADDVGDAPSTSPEAEVTWLADRANDVRLRVETDEAGWLVLLDSWDPGWEATVDGEPADVKQADFVYRAVRVPAGTSEVTFRYRPTSVVVGAVVSTVTSLAIVGVLVWGWIRVRRRPASAERQ